jgi:hypothetical protein
MLSKLIRSFYRDKKATKIGLLLYIIKKAVKKIAVVKEHLKRTQVRADTCCANKV